MAHRRHLCPLREACWSRRPRLPGDGGSSLPTCLYARQRLSRLLAVRTYPILTEAARDLGIHHSTLVIQINRPERDLGQPLLERAERGTAMKLTPFGKRVVTAARKIPAETDLSRGARVQQRRREDGAEQEGFPEHNR
ncbi:LysR family transcriptional regulator [Streptomyces sp. NPDC006990]|uniref:LysR family transcriptional regulator n=1 Tax=unclassified Streptomyces TaxID=2593676 RepID=UPI003452FC93